MFFQFFDELRSARIPVTLKEYLALMDALDKNVIDMKIDEFYFLSRAALVKDERNLDKFDQVFGHVFKGLENLDGSQIAEIPEEWLRALTREISLRRREERNRSARADGKADGDAERAPRRTEEAP